MDPVLIPMPAFLGWSSEQWFALAGNVAMAGWVILILGPRRWRLLNAVPSLLLPLVLCGGYAVLILTQMSSASGGFDSLANVASLFQSEALLLAGWVHFLAFDLFVGGWIASQADRRGVSRILQAPVLVTTLMLGPIGLAIYLVAFHGLPAAPGAYTARHGLTPTSAGANS